MSDENDASPNWRKRVQGIFFNGSAKPTTNEFLSLLNTAAEKELVDSQALSLFKGVYELRDLKASDVMVPKALMSCVKIDDGNKSLLELLVKNRHSRFPVIGEDIDDIRGILHAKDVLPSLREQANFEDLQLKDIIRTATRIPENKSLVKLLQEFRTSRNHMAIVVNEWGSVSGLVTIEDVLEQIVGDIEDEHDAGKQETQVQELGDGSFHVDPRISVVAFNEEFDTKFSNEDFDTLGGIVTHAFGHVPEIGEECMVDGYRFQVVLADPRRIKKLNVAPPPTS